MTASYNDPVPPQPAGSGAPAPKRTGKAPKILIIIGAVILVLSVIIGGVVAAIGIGTTAGGIGDIEVFDSGSGTVSAEAGDEFQVYVEEGTPEPTCSVQGPGPDSMGEGTAQTSSTTIDGSTWNSFDSFTAKDAGEYAIDCSGTAFAVGPPVSIGGIFGAVGGILLGLGGGFLGFVLLAIGVILLIMRRRRA